MQRNNPTRLAIPIRTKLTLVIFGFFLFLILLEVGLRLAGFILTSLQERRNKISIQQKGAYRIMCLGESTTAGEYPSFLEEALNSRNIGIKFSVIDKGVGATNTSFILASLESNLDTYRPDMVITMMGINDLGQYSRHMPYESVSYSKVPKFLKSFRVYKLTKLLWLHIVTKLREMGFSNLRKHIPLSEEASKFKKATALNPRNVKAFLDLARFYQIQGKFSEAEELYKKTIALNPRSVGAYIGLGLLYQGQGKFSESEESWKKAIALNPIKYEAYSGLGWLYQGQGKFSESEGVWKKAIALNPRSHDAYIQLGWLYRIQGKFSEAEELYKKAIALNLGNYRLYAELGTLYEEMGNLGLAREYTNKAKELGLNYYSPLTTSNYYKLKTILDRRGIVYVCVQYPMRSPESLRKIFEGEEGIIFVDNEMVFRRELKNAKYDDYFLDIFGGDFGHCTPKGNRLLAENIANTILKEVFHK